MSMRYFLSEIETIATSSVGTIVSAIEKAHEKSCFEYVVETIGALGVFLNLCLIWKVYKAGQKKTDEQAERQRKQQLFQVLVLDYNIKFFYSFFEELITEAEKLKQSALTDTEKGNINDALIKSGKKFRV